MRGTTFSSSVSTVVLMSFALAVSADAAGDAEKCLAAKIKAVSKYESCLYKSEATAVLKATTPDASKCETKLSEAWPKIELKYGLDCPTTGDQTTRHDDSQGHVDDTVTALKNEAPVCGDNQIDAGESCDGTNLGGETCVSQGYDEGTLACSGSCTFDVTSCSLHDCDVVEQTGCGSGLACYPLDDNELCAGQGSNTEGQPCPFANSCSPGLACVSGTCRVICDTIDSSPGCTIGQTCVAQPGWGSNAGHCE